MKIISEFMIHANWYSCDISQSGIVLLSFQLAVCWASCHTFRLYVLHAFCQNIDHKGHEAAPPWPTLRFPWYSLKDLSRAHFVGKWIAPVARPLGQELEVMPRHLHRNTLSEYPAVQGNSIQGNRHHLVYLGDNFEPSWAVHRLVTMSREDIPRSVHTSLGILLRKGRFAYDLEVFQPGSAENKANMSDNFLKLPGGPPWMNSQSV